MWGNRIRTTHRKRLYLPVWKLGREAASQTMKTLSFFTSTSVVSTEAGTSVTLSRRSNETQYDFHVRIKLVTGFDMVAISNAEKLYWEILSMRETFDDEIVAEFENSDFDSCEDDAIEHLLDYAG